jgi:hypothetical protein
VADFTAVVGPPERGTSDGGVISPVQLTLDPDQGLLRGSNQRDEKFLPELAGLYRDQAAFDKLLTDDDRSVNVVTTRFVTLFCYRRGSGLLDHRARGRDETAGGGRRRSVAGAAEPGSPWLRRAVRGG